MTEDLVAFPQKTDIIGMGSYNAFSGLCGIKGNHVPVSGGSGTRFYNCLFFGASASGDLFTLSGTYQHNVEFHNCYFSAATGGTPLTGAIISTAHRFLIVKNCTFAGIYSDAVIEFGAGNASGFVIENNFIQGNEVGIDCNISMTSSPEVCLINNKVFLTGGVEGLTGTDFNGCPIENLQGITDIFVARLDEKDPNLCKQMYRTC